MDRFAEAVAHFGSGRRAEAAALCQAIVVEQPDHARALHLLGMIRFAEGDGIAAAALLRRAVDLQPDYAEAHYNLGVISQSLGQDPTPAYRRCLSLRPAWAAPRINLGQILLEQNALQDAEEVLRPAVQHEPSNADALHNLGSVLLAQGRAIEAAELLSRAVTQVPSRLASRLNLGVALYDQADFTAAEEQFRALLVREPGHVDAHYNLANTLKATDATDAAIAAYQRVLHLDPVHAGALNNLGKTYYAANRTIDAVETLERAVAADPQSAAARDGLAAAYLAVGDCRRALQSSQAAIRLKPDDWEIRRGHLLVLNLAEEIDAGEVLTRSRAVHEQFLAPLRPPAGGVAVDRSRERRLRLGVIGGPMLRAHTLSSVLLPILEKLDPGAFELFVYSDLPPETEDWISDRYRALGTWRRSLDLDDQRFADAVRSDHVDLLVDPIGFVEGTRMRALARRPAPVQLSFPLMSTCGGDTIDVVVADEILVTPELESRYTENVTRMPFSYCYAPYRPTPALTPSPAMTNGHITFGSLNSFAKVSPGALAAWAEILAAIPASRLLIKARPLADEKLRRDIEGRFAAQGIAADRLELQGWSTDYTGHMSVFNAVDIALDSFPYGGVTTTCEALWMGVPVVTRPGTRALERYGASILSTAGFPEGIAADSQDYVRRAVDLARKPARLDGLRSELSRRFRASPVCDAAAAARAFEAACRTAWHRWCAEPS